MCRGLDLSRSFKLLCRRQHKLHSIRQDRDTLESKFIEIHVLTIIDGKVSFKEMDLTIPALIYENQSFFMKLRCQIDSYRCWNLNQFIFCGPWFIYKPKIKPDSNCDRQRCIFYSSFVIDNYDLGHELFIFAIKSRYGSEQAVSDKWRELSAQNTARRSLLINDRRRTCRLW